MNPKKLLKKTIKNIYQYFIVIKDYLIFSKLNNPLDKRFKGKWKDRLICTEEKNSFSSYDKHYVYHTAWAARILEKIKPDFHTDISSSIYFVAITSAFIPIKFYDYRPPNLILDNLEIDKVDLMQLPFEDSSIFSLSCLHVLEHVGLGRYGETIDPLGDLKAINELKRVIKENGNLLIVLPIGKSRISFNAHRIYSYDQVLSYFKEFELSEFALITSNSENGKYIINPDLGLNLIESLDYGCGCFWFRKNQQIL